MFIYKMNPYNYQSEHRWTHVQKGGNNDLTRGSNTDQGMANNNPEQ